MLIPIISSRVILLDYWPNNCFNLSSFSSSKGPKLSTSVGLRYNSGSMVYPSIITGLPSYKALCISAFAPLLIISHYLLYSFKTSS